MRRDRRADARRDRARNKRRQLFVTTAVVAASTLVGVAAAGTTYALLNDSKDGGAAVVSAGTMNLRINQSPSVTLAGFALSPTTPVAQEFSVENVGDVPATLSTSVQVTSTTAIGSNILARLTLLTGTQACAVGMAGAQGDLSTYAIADLGKLPANESRRYCLELSLKPGTPVAQSGQSATFTLTMRGAQSAN